MSEQKSSSQQTNNQQTNDQLLSGVADTLYIPLVARIAVSKKFPEYFYCQKSLDLQDRIPEVVQKMMQKEYEILASAARYYNLDRIYIPKNEMCNFVNPNVQIFPQFLKRS